MTPVSPITQAARSGIIVWTAQFAQYLGTFVLSVAIAARFGAARDTDAYFMASSTAELLAKILLGGAVVSVFLPVFVGFIAGDDEKRAWKLFSALFSLAIVAFLVFGTALEFLARPLMNFLAPGFTPETRALSTTLLQIVFPAYLFSFLADLATVPLHAFRRFGIPAFSRLYVPFLTLLILLTLADKIGVKTLAVGILVGTLAHTLTLLAALRRSGYRWRLYLSLRDPDLRRVMRLTLPFLGSILAAYGAGIVYRILVSHEPEGSLASLKFGEKIFQITNTLFLGSVVQVAFPIFARAAAGSFSEVRHRLETAVRVVVLLSVPLTVGIILLRTPLVRALYERGAFTPEATAATARLVPLFMIGLIGNGLSALLGNLALAFQASTLSMVVNITLQALATILFLIFTPRLGVAGLALVSGLGPLVLTALYAFALRRRVPRIFSVFLSREFLSILGAGALCAVAVRSATHVLGGMVADYQGITQDVAALIAGGSSGLLAYAAAVWLLRVPEAELVFAAFRQRLKRLRS